MIDMITSRVNARINRKDLIIIGIGEVRMCGYGRSCVRVLCGGGSGGGGDGNGSAPLRSVPLNTETVPLAFTLDQF